MTEAYMDRKEELYDGIIIGGGPAGLAAAIYLARAKYRVLVIEKESIGGQITITSEVVNYPGLLKTDGKKLTETMRRQAEYFGAEFKLAKVKSLDLQSPIKSVVTDRGSFQTLGIVLATGANPRTVGFKGEMEFRGRGVAYCATCDGEFFTGMDVFVIGGGFAAAEEAVFLTKYAKKVHIMVRGDKFACAESVAEEALSHPDIEVHFKTQLKEVGGEERLRYAVFETEQNTWRYESEQGFGVFVFAGYQPANELFKDKVKLTKEGYLLTDMEQKTNIEGVYGAGDICLKNLRQVVTAVSDGAVAATSMEKYISAAYERLGLVRQKPKIRKRGLENEAVKDEEARSEGFISEDLKRQLVPLLERLDKKTILEFWGDESPVSQEAELFGRELAGLCPEITCSFKSKTDQTKSLRDGEEIEYPAIRFCDERGHYMGTSFHGVPGGHEFNSFVIALYNAAGPGQSIEPAILDKIRSLTKPHRIQVVVSLSCTMCPELVMAVQRIALEAEKVEADIYDIAHFPQLKEKYRIMSVPCMIVDKKEVYFGKKGIEELLKLLA